MLQQGNILVVEGKIEERNQNPIDRKKGQSIEEMIQFILQ